METNKIFIDQESQTGDFLMRMPADALPAFYEMLLAAPLMSRRWFYQVKHYLEEKYNEPLAKPGLTKPKAQAAEPAPAASGEKGGAPC